MAEPHQLVLQSGVGKQSYNSVPCTRVEPPTHSPPTDSSRRSVDGRRTYVAIRVCHGIAWQCCYCGCFSGIDGVVAVSGLQCGA